ncbi:MAG: molybdopterin-dependent oxidoreductase [Hyphomicrobiales bacterium]|nr:molybdopterin-dependent oxidoreductase [Hyphomicrobiales bacterium]
MSKPASTGAGAKKEVPLYCNQCVCGPDLFKVEVENGVAVRIKPNFDIGAAHPAYGRVCVKAYGLIQKTYNPNRITRPMKRTNPLKGREHDPGFVPISWDEALDLVAGKLNEIRAKGITDESGYPRVAVSFGGGGTPARYMGAFPAFLAAWGPIDFGYGSGQGAKCYHSEHLYGELWHRAFTVTVDSPNCNYIINCGNNQEASSGVTGVWRQAEARAHGLKRVQVEPHLSVTGALSAEWLPIRPKTDSAFLFALIHRILHEHDWRKVCDVRFLAEDTNSPYLVGPNGYYLRDPVTRKPLIWDLADSCAKPFDAPIAEPALEGEFIASGVEEGPDEDRWRHEGIPVSPSFQRLRDHIARYTPEWAARECDVAVTAIRRVADEFLAHAQVGATIEIDGTTLPHRPVGILLGKGVNNGWGGYETTWARTMLACLVGALEVPGSTLGTKVRINRPADNRLKSVKPGPDGFMDYPFNPTSKEGWLSQPNIRNGYRTLVPLSANSPWSAALGPAHLPWLFHKQPPSPWPKQTLPDMWICYRTNPAISSWNAPEVARCIADFPFTVAFAYTLDETNYMADVLLPDATDIESLQLSRIGGTGSGENFWRHQGWAIRQPAVPAAGECLDMTDIGTKLAERTGLLRKYNEAVNRGAAGMPLKTRDFDYSLPPDEAHGRDAIWNAVAKAASHELSDGAEVHDIAWFREHGYMLRSFSQLEWYLYPRLKQEGLRFELPYQERIKRHGAQLARRLHEIGIEWWEHQLEEYQALPVYKPFPDIWTNYAREVGRDPAEFPFWALTARSMQYAWGANVGLPLINEIAGNVVGNDGIIINRGAARRLGIAQGDLLVVESASGRTRGHAQLREGIRPDTILIVGQFDQWATPYAKDRDRASLNSLTPLALSLTDATGSGADLIRVSVRRADGAADRIAS